VTTHFRLALKSTLDKVIKDLADLNHLDFVDLDGAAINSAKLLEANNAVAWATAGYSPYTGNVPFFDLTFEVGAITASDPSAYVSFDIIGMLMDVFSPLANFDIYDYSIATAGTTKRGTFTVINSAEQPLQTNDVEGLRIVVVTAKGSRHG
jgi:hypothetical protein